ncbi:nuclear transport factor 2 family protein [Mycolicibacterium elephantis]|uniref:nuclear transport factor 2 family protein n=1 Tax=Mycolicibacterium elephantis TaxID=81858 RepID=UPI0009ED5772|nr:nuclear transport factor 2 family protein [Mycolicibacterium elephantis]
MSVADTHRNAFEIRAQIDALVAEFAWLIDHKSGHGVADLFTPQGRYMVEGEEFDLQGRDEIEDFYARRRAAGPRTSRHLFSNLHFEHVDDDRARGVCVLTLHAADGRPPHPLKPVLVADYSDTYWRSPEGVWRYESRVVTPLFGSIPNFGSRTN